MENQDFIELELHYFFEDITSHSMNAKIHNECDKYFINTLVQLNKYLDFPFEVEVLAKEEGGVKSIYKICVKNPIVMIAIGAVIGGAVNQFFTSNFAPEIHVTEETKNKLDNISKVKEQIKSGNMTEEEFDYIAEKDTDLKKLKSGFFKTAKQDTKIKAIEISGLDKKQNLAFDKKRVESSEFKNYILEDTQDINEINVDAKIYIVAPILTKGRKDSWKGIYENQPIEFRVSDKVFLENVYHHIIKFSSGTYINCTMNVKTTSSSIDDKEKTSRCVTDVTNWGDEIFVRSVYKKKSKKKDHDDDIAQYNIFD